MRCVGVGLALILVLSGCGGDGRGTDLARAALVEAPGAGPKGGVEDARRRRAPRAQPSIGLEGFLVWESNRSGAWRLWTRDLNGSRPRQLSPDEPGRRHCCVHVAPGGQWVAYLSLPDGKPEYSKGDVAGPLRLIRPDASEQVDLIPAARTYFEHRAAVWRSDDELIYIDDQGRSSLIELSSRQTRRLTTEPIAEYGRLIDARLTYATGGRADFSPYDAERRTVAARADEAGCQPYFTHDGRWGFWMAGVGGPIHRIDLASRTSSAILHKNDARLPPGLGYLYFPMISRDGLLMAFAASPGKHDHFRSDYEIFVAETDPASLELIGPPIRFTQHRGTDRFPDVHLRPLALGRHSVEAPHALEWRAPRQGSWRWTGASGTGRGRSFSETYAHAGRFEVVATDGDDVLRGSVTVREAAPPKALWARLLADGRQLEVGFDEPLGPEPPQARLASGSQLSSPTLSAAGDVWRFEVQPALRDFDRLSLAGAVDRAQRPNAMEPAELEVPAPLWPTDPEALAFLWGTGATPNLVYDARLGAETESTVRPTGRAVLDRDFAMVLGRGAFRASDEDAARVLTAARAANRFSLEAWVTPGDSGRLIALGGRQVAFALRAEAGRLYFTLRLGNRGPLAFPSFRLTRVKPGQPVHVVVTFEPGRLRGFVDGEAVLEETPPGDLFHWRLDPFTFGDGVTVSEPGRAAVEGIAVYSRLLSDQEVGENYRRYRALVAARAPAETLDVEASLVRSSRTPTLSEISPYTEALAIQEWRVEDSGRTLRVAQWALMDGQVLDRPASGTRRRLRLQLFDDSPQLEAVFVQNDLGSGSGPLYYDID